MAVRHRHGAVLFLGASVSQLPAIRFARRAGYRVLAADGDPDAIGFSEVDLALAVDFTDVDAVTELANREGVDGVLAVCTDRAVVPAAEVAARLGLPGLDPGVARAMTDKSEMRAQLERAAMRQPRHVVLPGDTSDMRFPAVLKPVDSGGQRGVFRIDSPEELERRLPVALAFSRAGKAILEEFVDGSELNAIVVVRDGLPTVVTLSDRLRPPGDGFGVGWIHRYPSTLPADVLVEARRVSEAAVRAFGLRDGIAFPQLIASPDGVIVVEIAARIAAGQMADLVRYATGVELYDIAIRQALGRPIPDDLVTPSTEQPVAIRFLTAAPGVLPVGTVRSIQGLDNLRAAPHVLDAGLYFDVGATINPVQVDADRMGYVIATGESADDALAWANSAARLLRVEVGESEDEPRRRSVPRRRLAAVVVAALVAGVIGFFAFANDPKQPLITGARVVGSRITFDLVQRSPFVVRIVKASGASVATLLSETHPRLGLVHLAWLGRGDPAGVYYAEVTFPTLGRTLRFPTPITLDPRRASRLSATSAPIVSAAPASSSQPGR